MSGMDSAKSDMKGESRTGIAKDGLRVLHAEDSDDCAVLIGRALRRAGFSQEPLRFTDGEKAIGHLSGASEEERPHVILLDIHMPFKNGFDVLDWIRRHPSYQALPVLMLTSSEAPEDLERAKRLGATKFLHKDGTYHKVVEELEQLMVTLRETDGNARDGASKRPLARDGAKQDGSGARDGAAHDGHQP